MDALHKERRFALMMGVDNAREVVLKYNKVINRLIKLEQQYQKHDPDFKLADMWNCNPHNGQIKFNVTKQCHDINLKRKLLVIFNGVEK